MLQQPQQDGASGDGGVLASIELRESRYGGDGNGDGRSRLVVGGGGTDGDGDGGAPSGASGQPDSRALPEWTVGHALSEMGFGWFHYRLILVAGCCFMADGTEVRAVCAVRVLRACVYSLAACAHIPV